MLKRLKIGLLLLILIETACLKPVYNEKSEIYSRLFSFSGKSENGSFHSLRLFLHTDNSKKFLISVLLPTNTLVANAFFDGKRFVVVDYKNKAVYIDSDPPYDLEKLLGLKADMEKFMDFYKRCYLKNRCSGERLGDLRLIINEKREIIGLYKGGNFLLKPLGRVEKGYLKELSLKIPTNYRIVNE